MSPIGISCLCLGLHGLGALLMLFIIIYICHLRTQAADLNEAPPGARRSSNQKTALHRRARKPAPNPKTPRRRGHRVQGQMQLRSLRGRRRRQMGPVCGRTPADIRNRDVTTQKPQVGEGRLSTNLEYVGRGRAV